MNEETTLITGQTDTAPGTQQPTVEAGTAPVESGQVQQTEPVAGAQAEAQTATENAPDTPVEYADFNLPEGYALSGEIGDEFKAVAKELKLTQEQAQKMLDLDVKRTQAQQSALQQAAVAWQDASKSDKEFGGDLLAENMGLAKKALDAFGTPELKALLEQSGLGNHPEIIRAFYRAGKAISEDKLVVGNGATGGKPADARRVYAASNMNP